MAMRFERRMPPPDGDQAAARRIGLMTRFIT
jgi:hypothetical protein